MMLREWASAFLAYLRVSKAGRVSAFELGDVDYVLRFFHLLNDSLFASPSQSN